MKNKPDWIVRFRSQGKPTFATNGGAATKGWSQVYAVLYTEGKKAMWGKGRRMVSQWFGTKAAADKHARDLKEGRWYLPGTEHTRIIVKKAKPYETSWSRRKREATEQVASAVAKATMAEARKKRAAAARKKSRVAKSKKMKLPLFG
jgi:hypothetical protein